MDKTNFREVKYRNISLFFDKNYKFHDHFGHKRKVKKFPFYKNLLNFLENNQDISIYFTLDKAITAFKRLDNDFLINMEAYVTFCKSIESKTEGRAQAFLGQHLKLDEIFSQQNKDDFIKSNATERNILEAVQNLDPQAQERIEEVLIKTSQNKVPTVNKITGNEFIEAFSEFLADEDVQNAFFKNLPGVQIETLKSHLRFLQENFDKNETFFQDWIDEENGKCRKQRCLIFGIEYVDPKREGKLNEKRFDILAEQNRENHVLIELKSPNADIFSVRKIQNINGGMSTEYEISPDLARAIPQILGYKKWYEGASPEEIQALGIESKKTISKCIIVIGHTVEDAVWKENFNRIKDAINIEILTYDNLIDKLENSIKNLEENL